MKEKRMRKYRLVLQRLVPFLFAAAAIFAAVLLGTSSGLACSREETVVRNLVSLRIDAMNGYFSSQMSYKEAGELLKEAEADTLLQEDLKQMREFFRTDIGKVETFDIQNITFSVQEEDMLGAVVEICWRTEELDGSDCFTVSHSVICEKKNGEDDFKLVHFF